MILEVFSNLYDSMMKKLGHLIKLQPPTAQKRRVFCLVWWKHAGYLCITWI